MLRVTTNSSNKGYDQFDDRSVLNCSEGLITDPRTRRQIATADRE